MSALEIAAEAYRAFDRWREDHDPDGEMELLEAIDAYHEWAKTHSVAPYLDSAVASCQR